MEEDSLPSYRTSVSGVGRSGKALIKWPAHPPHPEPQPPALPLSSSLVFAHQDPSG